MTTPPDSSDEPQKPISAPEPPLAGAYGSEGEPPSASRGRRTSSPSSKGGRIALGAAVAAIVVLIGLAVVLFNRVLGEGTPPAPPAATSTSTSPGGVTSTGVLVPTPTSSGFTFALAPAAMPGAPSPQFSGPGEASPVAHPTGWSLFGVLVCAQCKNRSSAIVQSQASDGKARMDAVFALEPGEAAGAMAVGRQLFLLRDCRVYRCDGEPPASQPSVILLESGDRGATWKSLGRRAGVFALVGAASDGTPLVQSAPDGAVFRWGFITPEVAPSSGLAPIGGGWWSAERGEWVSLDGKRRFNVAAIDSRVKAWGLSAVVPASDGSMAVSWTMGTESTVSYLTVFEADGKPRKTWATTFRPLAWTDGTHLAGTLVRYATNAAERRQQAMPAMFDVVAGGGAGSVALIDAPYLDDREISEVQGVFLLMAAVPR